MADTLPPRKKPGRPRLDADAPSVSMNIRVPPKHYDRLFQRARQERMAFADYLRKCLRVDGESRKAD